MEARSPITPAFSANAVAFPDIPGRSESRLISSGIEIPAGKTVAPPIAWVPASVPRGGNLPLTDTFWNIRNPGVIDAARVVVENDIDGSADLYCMEAILRKHSDDRNLILDNKRHNRTVL
jgi:hypothetical protein